MTLIEAIAHAIDISNKCEDSKCAEEHRQLAKWLTELVIVKEENAKLRELAAGIGHRLFHLDVDYCATCPKDSINHPCPVYTAEGGECLYKTELRELGVEV